METKKISFHPFEARLAFRLISCVCISAAYIIVHRYTFSFFSSTVYAFLIFPAMLITIYWGLPAGSISLFVLFGISTFFLTPPEIDTPSYFKITYIPPISVLLIAIIGAGFLRGLLKKNVEQKKAYQTIIDHTYDSEYWIDPEGKLIYQSPSVERITGYPADAFFRGKQDLFFNIIHPEDKEHFQRHFEQEAFQTDEATTFQFRIITKDGNVKWLENISKKIFDPQGNFIGIRGASRNITKRKMIEAALHESETEYRAIVTNAKSVIVKYNMQGEITFFNRFAEDLFGYTAEEIIGRKGIDTINKPPAPEKTAETEKLLQEILSHTENYAYNENKNVRRDGREYWMAWTNASLYDKSGNKIGVLCIGNDITAQKKAEQMVQQRLEEKNVLLKEIHHRVKNNLQIISSMLNLQEDFLQDQADAEIFKTCENRISSMALVHDHLYHSENLAKIDIRDYVTALTGTILDSYYINPEKLHVEYIIDEVYLDIDQAIPCGLIITELLTNSIKHALLTGEDKKSELTVAIKKNGDYIHLEIADNGPGMEEDFDWRTSDSLGLKLVDALAAQLEADVSVSSKTGMKWVIRFTAEGGKGE